MTIDTSKVKVGDVFELNSGIRLVAVSARENILTEKTPVENYDNELIYALKKCSDENGDKTTLTGSVVISSVCRSAADRISQLLEVVHRQDKMIKKMRSCDNCKHRLIHGLADILDEEPQEPCLGCKEYNRWEII